MGKRYESDVLATVHKTALGLHEAGVMDIRTMREFDNVCLTAGARGEIARATEPRAKKARYDRKLGRVIAD